MTMFVVVERDSDGDIDAISGPFPSLDAGVKWLREVCIPVWAEAYEHDVGVKANVGFFGNGASEGNTCTYWIVKQVDEP
jgi:hypothetical protein